MKNDGTDKRIIIWIIVLLLPILFTIATMVIKKAIEDNSHEINRVTYVHAFYVKGTGADLILTSALKGVEEPHELILHDITKESDLYKRVLEYLELTEKVYNPLILVNSEYFADDYTQKSLEESIKLANATYSKKSINEEELLKYDVVDRIEAKEELYESVQ